METTEDEKIYKFKSKTFFFILGCAISFTFSATIIYAEFRELQNEIINLQKDNIITNNRIDKITKRNKDLINKYHK